MTQELEALTHQNIILKWKLQQAERDNTWLRWIVIGQMIGIATLIAVLNYA